MGGGRRGADAPAPGRLGKEGVSKASESGSVDRKEMKAIAVALTWTEVLIEMVQQEDIPVQKWPSLGWVGSDYLSLKRRWPEPAAIGLPRPPNCERPQEPADDCPLFHEEDIWSTDRTLKFGVMALPGTTFLHASRSSSPPNASIRGPAYLTIPRCTSLGLSPRPG